MSKELRILGLNNISSEPFKVYRVSDNNVIYKTRQAIDQQINDWKKLRVKWCRFNPKNACYSRMLQNTICWHDENGHIPLARFWCLIFDELRQVIYLFIFYFSFSFNDI